MKRKPRRAPKIFRFIICSPFPPAFFNGFRSVGLHRGSSSLAQLLLLSFLFVCGRPPLCDLKVSHRFLFILSLSPHRVLPSVLSYHQAIPCLSPDVFCLCLLQTLHFQSSLFIISSKNLRGICEGRGLYPREEKAPCPQVSNLRRSIPLAGRSREIRVPGRRVYCFVNAR